MRIAVFCPNLIGDTVMATPTLRALRRGFAGAHIAGILKPGVAPTLDGAPWLDERILFDPRARVPEHRTRALLWRLRASRFDLAVLLPNSFRSAALAWLAGIPRRVGYARGGRGPLLTDRLVPERSGRGRYLPTPMVGYYLALARLVQCPVDTGRLELFTTDAEERAADRAWDRLGLTGRRVVALNTGGAFGPAKSWPTEHFATLARRLATEAGAAVLVVCGPAERPEARAIVAQAGHPDVVSLAEEPISLGLTKASIRRAALLVTTDSGPRHFAAALGVPVVSLFGPTHIAWTRTHHPRAIHLRQPVPCGPCQKGVCPLGHHRCMRELDPGAVFAAAMRLLDLRRVGCARRAD
ncbi:MAG TPA: lipopolysaccharide heptosyltransferase II [Isosphaeraceae bacterium]|jgi:heptosyltransferase-2